MRLQSYSRREKPESGGGYTVSRCWETSGVAGPLKRLRAQLGVGPWSSYHPRPGDDPLPMPDLEEDPEEYEVEEVRTNEGSKEGCTT